MPNLIVRSCLRFHLEHQTPPSWSSEVVTHDECERHLRRLTRTACGCMRYGNLAVRPYARIEMASGLSTETTIARLFVTMSADRPLQGTDFACHACGDDPLCANPDHLYVGTHASNVRDKFPPARRIRPRREARFFDPLLAEIAAAPIPAQDTPTPRRRARAPLLVPRDRFVPPSRPMMPVAPAMW